MFAAGESGLCIVIAKCAGWSAYRRAIPSAIEQPLFKRSASSALIGRAARRGVLLNELRESLQQRERRRNKARRDATFKVASYKECCRVGSTLYM
jgi:hypothetical protein